MTEPASAPRRRWPFGLRTLLAAVLVAALCAWLFVEWRARQDRFVTDRAAYLEYVENEGGDFLRESDGAVIMLRLPESAGKPEIDEAQRLFPEAEIGHPKYRRIQ